MTLSPQVSQSLGRSIYRKAIETTRNTKCLVLAAAFAWQLCAFESTIFAADPFRLLSWNVESNRPNQEPVSDAKTIGEELKQLLSASATKSEVIALCEVDPRDFPTYVKAASEGIGGEVDFVTSGSGGYHDSDSVMLIVDKRRFEIIDCLELHRFGGIAANFNVMETKSDDLGELRARSPLAVRLKDKQTEKHSWFIANHLARGEADLRTAQAKVLSAWAKAQSEPVIAAGDFNFDYDFKTSQGNEGFKAMMESGVWTWLKPDPLLDSNWADDRRVKDKRVDRYPDSILDFVFVANGAKEWKGESDVIVREGDFPDSDKTSDHRPLITILNP